MDLEKVQAGVQALLEGLDIDLEASGMTKTPAMVATLYTELFEGLSQEPKDIWGHLLSTDYEGLVRVASIPFYSLCEHHLLPFFGTVDIVYQPKDGMVPGLGRIVKVVNALAHRPQLQERLAREIADSFEEDLGALGVLVRIESTQLCMVMRTDVQPSTTVMTQVARGSCKAGGALQHEALAMLERS